MRKRSPPPNAAYQPLAGSMPDAPFSETILSDAEPASKKNALQVGCMRLLDGRAELSRQLAQHQDARVAQGRPSWL
jgi:hypothetical protein